jgi:MOSC domain-containing protein YiiM
MADVKHLKAKVVQVLNTPDIAHFRTAPLPELQVDLQGIPGGRHYGFTRPAGARERWYKHGTPMRSGRQLTLVCAAELAEIASRMELPRIDPGWIGANVVIDGIPAFTLLPWGARLFFGEGAVLVNEGGNAPCRFAGAEIAAQFPERSGLDLLFPKRAQNLRGIVASVERAGVIQAGGTVRLKLPSQRIWPGGTLL